MQFGTKSTEVVSNIHFLISSPFFSSEGFTHIARLVVSNPVVWFIFGSIKLPRDDQDFFFWTSRLIYWDEVFSREHLLTNEVCLGHMIEHSYRVSYQITGIQKILTGSKGSRFISVLKYYFCMLQPPPPPLPNLLGIFTAKKQTFLFTI